MADAKSKLLEARELIAHPWNWAQGYEIGRDECGNVRMCAAYALYRVGGYGLDVLIASDLQNFNDTHTHAEVMAAFDRAIAAA